MNWERKEEWRTRGETFCVTVEHRTEAVSHSFGDEGPHRWCVYAYLYPTHPRFSTFDGDSLWQGAIDGAPLHGGCTFLRYHQHKDKVASVQVGADYHHLRDEEYTHMATKDEAGPVFADAEELVGWLSSSGPSAGERDDT